MPTIFIGKRGSHILSALLIVDSYLRLRMLSEGARKNLAGELYGMVTAALPG